MQQTERPVALDPHAAESADARPHEVRAGRRRRQGRLRPGRRAREGQAATSSSWPPAAKLQLAVAAHEKLAAAGIRSRVVSLPSFELFDEQPRRLSRRSAAARASPPASPSKPASANAGTSTSARKARSSASTPTAPPRPTRKSTSTAASRPKPSSPPPANSAAARVAASCAFASELAQLPSCPRVPHDNGSTRAWRPSSELSAHETLAHSPSSILFASRTRHFTCRPLRRRRPPKRAARRPRLRRPQESGATDAKVDQLLENAARRVPHADALS